MKTTKWTHFWDMHSGGGQKLEYSHIFIEANEETAKIMFENKFGRNPDNVTCGCCGADYSISEYDSLEQATSYHRRCTFNKDKRKYNNDGESLQEFEKRENICIIRTEREEGHKAP